MSLGSALSMSAPCSSCWASQRWLPLWLAKVCGMCSTWFIFRDDSSAGQGRAEPPGTPSKGAFPNPSCSQGKQ